MKNNSLIYSAMRSRQIRNFTHQSWTCIQCRNQHFAVSPSTPPQSLEHGKGLRRGIPSSPARTRFAPSPTGYLHLGSLRTALFNYLFAKHTGGQFLLRIEDTDQKRTVDVAEKQLYEDLQWVGLQWDEGPNAGGPYGPYRQSERTSIYQSHARQLVSAGRAYRCFCSPERLDNLSKHRLAAGLSLGYDRKCIDISQDESEGRAANGEKHVVRLKTDGYPMFHDIVYGKITQNQSRGGKKKELIDGVYEDPILLKSDGHPTYHLANVVDDHLMKITHVIRGTEWMASTPMHVALYDAFGWQPPEFGHVPILVDGNGQKLSKRNADIDIAFYRENQGILPEALVNFAALLGWSHSRRSDLFILGELEKIFTFKITKGNTIVTFEKLSYLQKAHAKRIAEEGGRRFDDLVTRITTAVEKRWSRENLDSLLQGRSLTDYTALLLQADAKSYINTDEFLDRNATFFVSAFQRPKYVSVSRQHSSSSPLLSALKTAVAALSLVPESHWTTETHRSNISSYNIGANIQISDSALTSASPTSISEVTGDMHPGKEAENRNGSYSAESQGRHDGISIQSTSPTETTLSEINKIFKKELYHYLRWALSAGSPGPGIPETMTILGRNETLRRLDDARQKLSLSAEPFPLSPSLTRNLNNYRLTRKIEPRTISPLKEETIHT